MSYEAEHSEIQHRLDIAWAATTPIAWPNISFTPPNPQQPWLRLQINDGDANQINIGGSTNVSRYSGVIFIQIFTEQNKGAAKALQLADAVKSIFHNWCGVTVRCRQAKIRTIGNDGNGWYQTNVSIPFIRDEQI